MIPADKLAKFMSEKDALKWRPTAMRGRTTRQCLLSSWTRHKTRRHHNSRCFNTIGAKAVKLLLQATSPRSTSLQSTIRSKPLSILSGIDGIAQVFLNEEDVVDTDWSGYRKRIQYQ